MKKWLLHGCLLGLTLGVSGQTKIRYTVFYDDSLEQNGLKVELDYTAKEATDTSMLYYRNRVWGENDIYNCLKFRPEDNPGMWIKTDPEHHSIRVAHEKSKRLRLTYRIKQDYREPSYDIFNRPRVHNHYFHVLGQSLFMVPMRFAATERQDEQLDVQVDWTGFPETFKIHNTFASETRSQKIKTDLWTGLYHSLFVGGDYRIYPFEHHKKKVYFAVRGNWLNGFTDDFLLDHARKAIISQRDFWNDYGQDYFTIILTPTVTQNDSLFKGQSHTGSAVRNGFMIQGTNNPFNDADTYRYMLHHELMHYWIAGKIANRHEELNYWFSEGFTDYYTYKNRLRINDISFAEWLRLFNKEVIGPYWKNPERNRPNYVIKDLYWESRDIEKLPYRRGAIFAFWLDNRIMLKTKYSKSLDDFMRDLLGICVREKRLFDDELFLELAHKYLEENISAKFQKNIIVGEDMDLVNEKWIGGFLFTLVNGIPTLGTDGSETPRLVPR